MDSFLARVYRHNEGNSQDIAGTVEEITTSQNSTFRTLDELGEFFLPWQRQTHLNMRQQNEHF